MSVHGDELSTTKGRENKKRNNNNIIVSGGGNNKNLVKEVWYRALRACPWSKELYILGFELLGDNDEGEGGGGGGGEMELRELRSAWRVMTEKELRVHVDIEEEFKGSDEEG